MNIGYLGFGAMGSAVAESFAKYCAEIKGGEVTQYAYAPHQDKLRKRAAEVGAVACASARELVGRSDMVILACKPYQAEEVLRGVRDDLQGKALVSVVNAWRFADFKRELGDGVRVQCIMPSIPMKVGRGARAAGAAVRDRGDGARAAGGEDPGGDRPLRLRSGVFVYGHRGDGRRGRQERLEPPRGVRVGGGRDGGRGRDGAPRPVGASRRAQGRGLLARRHHHPRRRRTGGGGHAQRVHPCSGCDAGRLNRAASRYEARRHLHNNQ